MPYNWKFNFYKLTHTLALPAPKPTQAELALAYEEAVYKDFKKLNQRQRCVEMSKHYLGKVTEASTIKIKVLQKLNREYFKARGLLKLPYGSHFRYIEEKWLNRFVAEGGLQFKDGVYKAKNWEKLNSINTEYTLYQKTPKQLLI